MNIVLALLISVTALFAPALPATPAPALDLIQALESQAPHVPASLVGCEEDNPCWDCATMGNKVCGPEATTTAPTLTLASVSTSAKLTAPTAKGATEAWSRFETRGFTEEELSHEFRVTYKGTTASPNRMPNGHEWYTIPTASNHRIHHVFEIEFNYKR